MKVGISLPIVMVAQFKVMVGLMVRRGTN